MTGCIADIEDIANSDYIVILRTGDNHSEHIHFAAGSLERQA